MQNMEGSLLGVDGLVSYATVVQTKAIRNAIRVAYNATTTSCGDLKG